jgi:hypothetical protein
MCFIAFDFKAKVLSVTERSAVIKTLKSLTAHCYIGVVEDYIMMHILILTILCVMLMVVSDTMIGSDVIICELETRGQRTFANKTLGSHSAC